MTDNKKKLGVLATRYGTLLAMILVFIFFAIVTERFLRVDNLLNILNQNAYIIVMGF